MTKEADEYNRLLNKAYGQEAREKCSKCIAKCCSVLPGNIYITLKDVIRFKAYKLDVVLIDILKTKKTYLGRMASEGQSCPYYQKIKGKFCRIYNARPDACRKFSPSFCGMYQEKED